MGLSKAYESLEITDGSLEMNGGDVNNAGTVGTEALEADKADTRSGYNDVTSSRSFNTTETNNTGSDLDVIVTAESTADATDIILYSKVGGTATDQNYDPSADSGSRYSVKVTVPNGSDYEVNLSGDVSQINLQTWVEQA